MSLSESPGSDIGPRTTIALGVSLVHLVSGEDLIARVEYDAEANVYSLSRPTTPVMQPKVNPETGQQTDASVALMPYRIFLDPDEPLLIRDGNVVFTGKIAAQLEKHYTQITSDVPSHLGELSPQSI